MQNVLYHSSLTATGPRRLSTYIPPIHCTGRHSDSVNIPSEHPLANGAARNNAKPPKITPYDLAPAPMHGSAIRVAYQGVPGAYSEAAAASAFPNSQLIPCDQFGIAFEAVETWVADRAVLPVYNSVGGQISTNFDLLASRRLKIVGEVVHRVRHCLLALPGVPHDDISRVISHPQAISQCRHSLTNLGLGDATAPVDDTAGAAQFIAENNLRDTAAIASSRAADLYRLHILADGIEDDPNNRTRFVILARDPVIPGTDRPFKTTVVLALREGVNALHKVLTAFHMRNIEVTAVNTRPHRDRPIRVVDDIGKTEPFHYLFFIDFKASMAEVTAQQTMSEVQTFTSFLRVLGSYPIAQE